MKPGRKRTPQKILKLQGSWRAKTREDFPVDNEKPELPSYLSEELRPIWDKTVNNLEKLGILSRHDEVPLALYCKAWLEWREADEACSKLKSFLITNPTSKRKSVHPLYLIRGKAWERMRKICNDFAMTPTARTGIAVIKKPEQTDKSRFFTNTIKIESEKRRYPT